MGNGRRIGKGEMMSSFTSELIVTPLDGRRWKLKKEFTYHIGSKCSSKKIMIPSGFITDFASSPRIFWPIVSPWGKWGKAAVLHDYLYWLARQKQYFVFDDWSWASEDGRKAADDIFLEAMEVLGVKRWRRFLMYWGVRAFGFLAWR